MKITFRLVQLAVLLALGFWLWTVLFPSPQKIIRKRLHSLAADVSFSKNDGTLTKLTGLAGAANVADYFSTNVAVNIDIPGHEQHALAGRDEITQYALAAHQEVATLSVKFPDITVTVAPDKQSAVADVTVEVHASGQTDDFVQELKISFAKTDRQWLINQVDTVQPISQPTLK
jgi:hypothetical protein